MTEEKEWLCKKCGIPLENKPVVFDYLSLTFSEKLLRCPKCGKVLIPEELATGKMTEVESQLEEK